MDLFHMAQDKQNAPLAERMRPTTLDAFFGQSHLVGDGKLLRRAIQVDRLTSCIFYGPPGSGKTTLASIIANTTSSAFEKLNAVTSGVGDVRKIIQEAADRQAMYGKNTYLLLDECHRWNKAQSDSILPALEKGTIRFIGSTTENPMIAMTPAIVSRCTIFQLYSLELEDIVNGLKKALTDKEKGIGHLGVQITDDALQYIASTANGDMRSAYNGLELAALSSPPDKNGIIHIDLETAQESMQKPLLQCDESTFYDMLSAFCKSIRGSDPDAALAWFAKMTYAGVDPRIIVRRMIVHASEDIGLAEPSALVQAVSALHALESIGMPEARIPIGQAIIYLCKCPKSDSVINAVSAAMEDTKKHPMKGVPIHLRDTHYAGHVRLGNAEGEKNGINYLYPHNYKNHWVEQQYMPDELVGTTYYHPSGQGKDTDESPQKSQCTSRDID